MSRAFVSTLMAVLLLLFFADAADAQRRGRRRRRRRRQPPAEEPVAPPAEEAAADPEDAAVPPASDVEAPETPPDTEAPPVAAEPSELPAPQFDPGPAPPDVTPIRTDFVALMDDLVQARMRVSALGSELFRTRITIDLQDRTGDGTSLARLVVHLDGAPVFQTEGAVEGGDDGREVFSGSLAPGPHVLRLEVEQRASTDDAYRYTLQEDFRFQVTRERLSEVTLILEDSSDIASSFPSGGEGRYEVSTRMRVATRALPDQ